MHIKHITFILSNTEKKLFYILISLPERRLEFEEFLSSLGSFWDIVSEHANSEELANIPVVIHFLQGTFASQKTVQPHT